MHPAHPPATSRSRRRRELPLFSEAQQRDEKRKYGFPCDRHRRHRAEGPDAWSCSLAAAEVALAHQLGRLERRRAGLPVRATVTPIPEPSYRISPTVLGVVLLALASRCSRSPVYLLRRRRARRAPKRTLRPALSPLERALGLVEWASRRPSVDEKREALEALAFELDAEEDEAAACAGAGLVASVTGDRGDGRTRRGDQGGPCASGLSGLAPSRRASRFDCASPASARRSCVRASPAGLRSCSALGVRRTPVRRPSCAARRIGIERRHRARSLASVFEGGFEATSASSSARTSARGSSCSRTSATSCSPPALLDASSSRCSGSSAPRRPAFFPRTPGSGFGPGRGSPRG